MDYVMPDVQRIGGVTGWLRAAAIAHAYRMEMSSHLFPEYSAHLLGVTPTRHWLEYADWAAPVIAEPLQIRDGRALDLRAPGKRYQLERGRGAALRGGLTSQGDHACSSVCS